MKSVHAQAQSITKDFPFLLDFLLFFFGFEFEFLLCVCVTE